MLRLRPAAVGARCQARFNSSASTSNRKPPRKPRVVAELGGITIPSRDELKQQTPLPAFKPDLSYLNKAPSSVAARVVQAVPTQAPEIVEKAKRSAKQRREQRLAREREEANVRETAAASALDALIGQAEYTKTQLAPSTGIQTPLARANMKLANTSAEAFDTLVEHALQTATTPERVPASKVPPGSRAAAAAKARREARLRQEESAPPQEEAENSRSRLRKRRQKRRRSEGDFDMTQFTSIESDLQAEFNGEVNDISDLTPTDLTMIPLEAKPDYVGPVPVSETLMEILHPMAEQPAVIDPQTNKTHPISTGLVTSFLKTDYSSYVPKNNTYQATPLKTDVLQYARQALARNPSIALAQRRHALELMERAAGGKR